MEKVYSNKAKNHRKSNAESPKLRDDDVPDTIDNADESLSSLDHDQISSAIDSFIDELSTDDKTTSPELPDIVDTFVKIVESNIKAYNNIQSGIRFAKITKEDELFMEAIKRLSKLKIALGEFPNSASFNTIKQVLQLAIVLIEDEFRAILQDSNAPSETITKGAEPEWYNHDDFPGYSKENVILMNKIASVMIPAGYQYECCLAYSEIRKDELDDQIKRFEFDKVSMEDVHKSKWVSLEPDITRWVKLTNHCSRVLFVEERKLGETVFSEHLPVFTGVFINLIRGITTSLLEFPTTVAIEKPKAKRLFKFLDIYESIHDLSVAVEESDSNDVKLEEYCNLKSEISIVGDTIGEVVVNMFNDLKQTISNDNNKTTVQGAVHPLTRYVMGYVKCAFDDYHNTLEHIFRKHVENEASSNMENSSLSQQLLDVIELLDANLETKSTSYKDPSLRYIFLMNNNRYCNLGKPRRFLKKQLSKRTPRLKLSLTEPVFFVGGNVFLTDSVKNRFGPKKTSSVFKPVLKFKNTNQYTNRQFVLQLVKETNEMKQVMGDNWCRRKSSDVRNYHKSYQRETWTKLLQWLTQEGIQVHGKPSRRVLKDRFKNFNAMFDEIHKTQSTWVVSDQQLLSEMRVSINAVVSPAYRSFIGRYKSQFEGSKSIDKYIKYQPEDIESLIETLFEGNLQIDFFNKTTLTFLNNKK
ncbi:putative exocyst complex component Exo70, cullin repeat-like-containing domain superfamily [Helianthus annuus]|nr:putative exocyst complex component Exo70, cullin repeat-like-containing domain superfamily [Helianthus annuus]KAJ0717783.1 putative exocyst complex component Exo70, cullin repeat-like-containing domain superfamily [Helianthus annuus]